MITHGIRIHDEIQERVLLDDLSLILEEIHNGADLKWSILSFEGLGNFPEDNDFIDGQDEIIELENGYRLDWETLCEYSKYITSIDEIVLIGSKDYSLLKHYGTDQEMYETCDVVIVLFDCYFWEIFSKDPALIERYTKKFQKIDRLKSDFQTNFDELETIDYRGTYPNPHQHRYVTCSMSGVSKKTKPEALTN